jgi:hypothetical protein
VKALSLWQPWASLVALGAKRVETRDWPPPVWMEGQRIAIHAAKTTDHLHLCGLEPFSRHVARVDELPLGAIVATVRLVRCSGITEQTAELLQQCNPEEFLFGNYDLSEGQRYAWVLDEVERLEPPVPWRGMPYPFDVPDDLRAHAVQLEMEVSDGH